MMKKEDDEVRTTAKPQVHLAAKWETEEPFDWVQYLWSDLAIRTPPPRAVGKGGGWFSPYLNQGKGNRK